MNEEQETPENERLIRSASQGDGLALETLFQRHISGLRTFLRLRMGPQLRARESASDLAQSVCREVLEHIDRFQHGGEAEFRNWLYKEGLRKMMNRMEFYSAQKRDIGREVHVGTGGENEDDNTLSQLYRTLHTPSAEVVAREGAERLQLAFDRLPEDQREVIILSKMIGLPHKRIAEEMGRSEAATRALLHRALVTLASELERNP